LQAAAAGAFVHASTLRDLPDEGVVASDLIAELHHHD
jgi:hypothetical protein